MNSIVKKSIISFFVSGLVYAVIMAGFEYKETSGFDLGQFLIHWLVFGALMGILNYFTMKRNLKNKKNE